MTYTHEHICVEICLAYPDGSAKTVVVHSESRPWSEDGILYVADISASSRAEHVGYPMMHVRSFRSSIVHSRASQLRQGGNDEEY